MNNTNQANPQGQDRIAGTLGAILFFLPILMERKTEFTTFYMRQNFVLILASVWAWMIKTLPFIGFIGWILHLVIFFHLIFLAWKAYSGERFEIPYLYKNGITISQKLGIDAWFTPNK